MIEAVPYQQVVVRMPVEMYTAVKRCAEQERRTMAEVIRESCRRYLAESP